MYPLNMKLIAAALAVGFAVANDEAEHKALSAQGYEPKFVPPPEPEANPADADGDGKLTKAEVMAALDEAGIAYDKRQGLEKLKALLPKAD